MAITSEAGFRLRKGPAPTGRLARLAWKGFRGLSMLWLPPICLHCQGRRLGSTPLCPACLRRLLRKGRLGAAGCETCGRPDCRDGHAYGGQAIDSARFLFRVTAELSTVVHGFKYRRMRRNADFLAAGLRYRPDLLAYIRSFHALVPVPLHSARARERGYNQAEVIATAFGAMTGVPVLRKALRRPRPTGTQTRLGREERLRNLDGAFACPEPDLVQGRKLLLVDDVFTTGATVSACARVLKASGCRHVGVTALGWVETGAMEDDFVREMEAVAAYLA